MQKNAADHIKTVKVEVAAIARVVKSVVVAQVAVAET